MTSAATVGDLIPMRIVEKIDTSGDCWLWVAALDTAGYGSVRIDGRLRGAHRAVYELLVGPVPEGMELDHTCHSLAVECVGGPTCIHRRCVNPDHLEPVTPLENMRRSEKVRRETCKKGHPFSHRCRTTGQRRCATCHNEATRKHKAKKRGEQ